MKNKAIILTIFAIAMACLESAVVVFLRELYYPSGFTVAFVMVKNTVLNVEIIRELATIIMLYSISCIMTKKTHKRFAWFLYSFAIWDIFYYIWLKVFINWPNTVFELDILFLVPITWIGPVLAPVICSLTMIALAYLIIKFDTKLNMIEWCAFIFGSVFILFTFMYDYGKMLWENNLFSNMNGILNNPIFIEKATELIPIPFQWRWFCAGIFIILIGMANIINRNKNTSI